MDIFDQDRLVHLIETTFLTIPKPDCTKRVARALDEEWAFSRERADELKALDQEKNWQDLEAADIYEFSEILFWLSPDGFRFYFPAYLRYSILTWERPHDRTHLECMEVVGRQSGLLDSMTAIEAQLLAEILTELSVDPRGEHYDTDISIRMLELHARKAEQSPSHNT